MSFPDPDDPFDRQKQLAYAVAFAYSLVCAVLWVPVFLARRVGRIFRESGTESWPRANGSITACDVKVIHGWIVDYALAKLEYCYKVSGEYYAGSTMRQYPDEQAAWEFVDARRSKAVVVRYKDHRVEACVLIDADQEPLWASFTEPSFFVMLWRHWSDELRDPPDPSERSAN